MDGFLLWGKLSLILLQRMFANKEILFRFYICPMV